MADKSSFKQGSGSEKSTLNGQVSNGKDTYDGKYKDPSKEMSEAEKWGTDKLPVENGQLPASGLRGFGG
jgi:hypothetical protein